MSISELQNFQMAFVIIFSDIVNWNLALLMFFCTPFFLSKFFSVKGLTNAK
jgi:uncharacterized protein YqhQ